MMQYDPVALLKESRADAFEMTDVQTRAYEFYLIRHKLDQHRVRMTRDINVTVYRHLEDGRLGEASGEIAPTLTKEEAKREIERLYENAAFTGNPPFTLHPAPQDAEVLAEAGPAGIEDISADFLKAMQDVTESDTEDINSYEIFVEEKTRRIVNSAGLDVTDTAPSSMVEVVINARKKEDTAQEEGQPKEIELYRMYSSGTCDSARLKAQVEQTMRFGADRLVAKKTPALREIDVIFSAEDAKELYDWFLYKVSARALYMKRSDWTAGTTLFRDGKGDSITLKAVPHLDNSSRNAAFDAEGAPVKERVLIEDGVVKAHHGRRKFACYLNLEDTFIVSNVVASGGTKTEKELRSGRYLEAVDFSDFSVDYFSGEFAGELRLGYLHDGERITPVTGGSLSGTLSDLAGGMEMSREQAQYDYMLIPTLTRLPHVTVSGIA